MNNKFNLKVVNKNLFILVFSTITTIFFMKDINQALYTPINMGPVNINSVGYTLLSLKIDVIQGDFHNLYTIYNYPLIPIFIGVIYNIYILIKIYWSKDNL